MTQTSKAVLAGALVSVAIALAGCVGPYSPISADEMTSTQSTVVGPNTTAPELTIIAFIDALNKGDRARALDLSCGIIHTQISRKSDEDFQRAAQRQQQERGNGAVRRVTDMTDGDSRTTARVSVRYDKHTAGMSDDNTIVYLGMWEKSDGRWRICDLVGES